MRFRIGMTLSLALCLSTLAAQENRQQKQRDEQSQESARQSSGAAATESPGHSQREQQASTPQSVNDRQFVQRAAQIHMTEAHLGQMAQSRAKSDELKDMGGQAAKKNREAYSQLSRISQQFAFTVPEAIDAEHQNTIKRMEGLNDNQFDRAYKQHVSNELRERAKWFRSEAAKLDNPDLKQYASAQAAQMEDQAQRAQNIDLQNRTTAGNQQARIPRTDESQPDEATAAAGAAARTSAADVSGQERHGTVTAFERGKTLDVKFRDRMGQHRYELSGRNVRADVPQDLQPGTEVVVTERIDRNGYRTLEVRRDTSSAGGVPSTAGQRSDQHKR